MKKTLSLLLVVVLCFSLCACGSKSADEATTVTTEPLETIGERPLLVDSDNAAKAQLNVGKATTIHGVVTDIGVSACTIKMIYPQNATVYVEMPIEQLAELSKNLFVSIEGVVSSFNALGDNKYVITATQRLGSDEMDNWIKKTIAGYYNFNGGGSSVYDGLLGDFDMSLINAYAKISGDVFKLTDDAQLKEYLIGEWVYGTSPDFWFIHKYCTYNENGRYITTYQNGPTDYGDWTVSDGTLKSITGYTMSVYVLCDGVFIHDDLLYVKTKS